MSLRRANLKASLLFSLVVAGTLSAQVPDTFTNLQVLPKEVTKQELMSNMRSFAIGMGVRCSHCHVGEEGQPLSTFDFASDEKDAKETARVMMRMRNQINQHFLSLLPDDQRAPLSVNCATCHHGQAKPFTLAQTLTRTLNESGLDAAIAKYRELREQNYGGFSFDFRERPLVGLASQLDDMNAAIAFLKLNIEFYPESGMTYHTLGEAFAEKGDTQMAIKHFTKALELQPNNRRAKKRLDELANK